VIGPHCGDPRAQAQLGPASADLLECEGAEPLGHLAHDPVLGLDQHKPQALGAATWIQPDDVEREVLDLGQSPESGVATTDEHERQPLGAFDGVLERLGHLERAQDPVSETHRLGEGLETDSVLDESRYR
jgi:hypothetical protein